MSEVPVLVKYFDEMIFALLIINFNPIRYIFSNILNNISKSKYYLIIKSRLGVLHLEVIPVSQIL